MKTHIQTKIISFIFVLMLFSTPATTFAVSFGDLNTQIAELLAQVFTLKAKLKSITDLDVTATSTPRAEEYKDEVPFKLAPPSDVSCLRLKQNLSLGSRGPAVTRLQMFLARQSYIYPEAIISGYFGTKTKRAVERWQVFNGITNAFSGGYGVVGPKTRASFAKGCPPEKKKDDKPKPPKYDVLVKEVETNKAIGSKPFHVVSTFTLVDKCTSFVFDWGDGTAPFVYDARGKRCDGSVNKIVKDHVYPRNGVYLMVLRAGRQQDPGALKLILPVVYNKAVVVGGNILPFTVTPLQGSAPFSATAKFSITHPSCTSYAIDWGDGTSPTSFDASVFTCQRNVQNRTFTHVYDEPGVYTVRFRMGRAPLNTLPELEQWEVTVNELAAGKTVVQVSKSTGRAPLTVHVKLSGADGQCMSYRVDWGDGTPKPTYEWVPPAPPADTSTDTSGDGEIADGDFVDPNDTDFTTGADIYSDGGPDCSGSFEKEFTHTYVGFGSYPLRIKFGKGPLKDLEDVNHWVSVFR